jgi:hypothetical protein
MYQAWGTGFYQHIIKTAGPLMICMKLYLLLLFSCLAVACMAQDKIECDRPDQTETPAIVPSRFFQFESGYYYKSEADEKDIVYPSALLKYGLDDVAELRFELENATVRTMEGGRATYHTGVSPVSIGAKLKICDERKHRPQASVIIMTSIPILASKGLQENYPSPEIRFTMQHTFWDKKVYLAYNFGGLCRGSDFKPVGLYTLTSGISLNKDFGCFAEFYGFVTWREKQDHRFDGGFTYTPVNNIMLDITAGLSMEQSPAWFCGLGFSFRLPE